MSKISYFILFVVIIGLSSYFNFDKLIQNKSIDILNGIKLSYISAIENLEESIDVHFNQSEKIKKLTQENKEFKKYKLLFNDLNTKVKEFQNFKNTTFIDNINIVDVISYGKFDDFTKIYVNTYDLNISQSRIGGLIVDDYAAGILIKKDNKSIGLLNGNEKANYAVYIGEVKAPGITHSIKNKKDILVKFIPNWLEIKVGDEVITSGMDNIFFEGLKVGKVKSIKSMGNTQEAKVEPYANISNNEFYYLYYKN